MSLFRPACGPVSHLTGSHHSHSAPHWWVRCTSCDHLVLVHQRQMVGEIPIRCDCGATATEQVATAWDLERQLLARDKSYNGKRRAS